MQQRFTKSVWLTTLLVSGIFALAFSAYAQKGQGMMGGNQGMRGACAQQMVDLHHDLAGQMKTMSEAMSEGNLSPALQKQMSERMQTMATMVDDMSGMMGKGMMKSPEGQERMQQMRTQMDTLMHGEQPPAK